jgi:hypothetical protein
MRQSEKYIHTAGISFLVGAIVMGCLVDEPIYDKGYTNGQIAVLSGDDIRYELATNSVKELVWTEITQ